MNYKNKKTAIIGFGVEGHDAYRFLRTKRANISIFDKADKKEIDLQGVELEDKKIFTGQDYLESGLDQFDLVVRSAGVRPDLDKILQAEKSGVVVTSTTKIFFEEFRNKIIGVTGTKGKGTTSSLIYKILQVSGKNVHLAGNIGTPVLDILTLADEPEFVVLELSSFQLMDLDLSPHIAVVLNITLDHMDWHKNEQEYYSAKENIVKNQSENDFAVISYDHDRSRSYKELVKSITYFFSKQHEVKGCFVKNGQIFLNVDKEIKVGDTSNLQLRGKHNWENVTAASLAAYLSGAELHAIRSSVFSFKGLEHRLEFVREVDGVKFYNDSFSTTIHTTLAAVASFDEQITLILGGFDKGLDYESLVKEAVKTKNLKKIILIGDLAGIYMEWFDQYGFEGDLINLKRSEMKKIVQESFKRTKPGGVVVLSPSSSSFDMFDNYKDRGIQFKKAVNKL